MIVASTRDTLGAAVTHIVSNDLLDYKIHVVYRMFTGYCEYVEPDRPVYQAVVSSSAMVAMLKMLLDLHWVALALLPR